MRTQSTALPTGAARDKHFVWCDFALPAMNRLQINRVKTETSWLIPNTSPKQKRKSRRTKPRASKVRYAVVGLGYITQIAVLPAFKHAHETSELVALVSGDEEKRRKLATKYKVNKTFGYERYANCLASGDIDAVYIALPNNMHRAHGEGAARLGFRSSLYRSCQSGIGGS